MAPVCEKPDSQEGSICAFFHDNDTDGDSCMGRKCGMKTCNNCAEAQNDGAIATCKEGMPRKSNFSKYHLLCFSCELISNLKHAVLFAISF